MRKKSKILNKLIIYIIDLRFLFLDYSPSSSPESITYSPFPPNSNENRIGAQGNNMLQYHTPEHGIINNFPVELEYIKFPDKLYKTQVISKIFIAKFIANYIRDLDHFLCVIYSHICERKQICKTIKSSGL